MRCDFRPTIIELLLDEQDRNRAQLWLPEFVMRGETDHNSAAIISPVQWQSEGRSWRYKHFVEQEQITIAASVEATDDGFLMSMSVANHSDQSWPNVAGIVCLLLGTAPDFANPDRTRSWFRAGGKLQTFAGSQMVGGQPPFRMSLVRGMEQVERTKRHRNKWGFTQQESDDGVIAVTSPDEKQILALTWQQVHHLQLNACGAYCCIHANPAFGNMAPGEQRTVHGAILLSRGSLESAWEKVLGMCENPPHCGSGPNSL